MIESELTIDVEKTSLGGALRKGPLCIPPYQREYSWKKERVRKLFDDLNNAMVKRLSSYFLGTVVLTPGRPPSIIDGQQRLATTMIFLAAVRDAMLQINAAEEASTIENDFLLKYERSMKEWTPRLIMNTDDRSYMKARVLDRTPQGESVRRLHSHQRIDDAARIAAERVNTIMSSAHTLARKIDALNAWVDFIDQNAIIVMLTPPNASRAYQMFKTLNDRAQRTTQADMIKNHLFEQADDSAEEAQSKWSSMRSTIEAIEQNHSDDPLLTYLHHVSIVFNGPVKAEDIFEMMEESLAGRSKSLLFLESLASMANDYAAIVTPTHAKWGSYDRRVRMYVKHISQDVKMSFIRPLMLAVAARFSVNEAFKAFRMFVSWVVRFLIAGGSRSGNMETAIGNSSRLVNEGKITTADELAAAFSQVVPNDVKFRSAFLTKTLTSARQVRFLLTELEAQARGGTPEQLEQPVDDTSILSLEHILPKNPTATEGWEHFSPDAARVYRWRLGNLALLNSRDNGAIGDRGFDVKRPVIERSRNILLTGDVFDRTTPGGLWTEEHINGRQELMADLAVKHWPLTY